MSEILTTAEFRSRLKLSPASFERALRDGQIPQPFRLSDNSRKRYWASQDIDEWISQRMSARSAA